MKRKRNPVAAMAMTLLFIMPALADELSITGCMRSALSGNPRLKVARQAYEQAMAEISVAESGTGPEVTMSASAKVVSVVPEMDQPDMTLPDPLGVTIPGQHLKMGDYDSYSLSLEVRKVVYAGGRLNGSVDRARLASRVAEVQVAEARREVLKEVALAHIDMSRVWKLREIARQALASARAHAHDVANLHSAGAVTRNEVLKAELRVSEKETECIELDQQVSLLLERLRMLCGARFGMPDAVPVIRIPDSEPPDAGGLEGIPEHTHPEIAVIRNRMGVIRKAMELTMREKRPVVSVFGGAAYGKPGPDFIKNRWIDSYRAGISCNLNVWDNHRVSSRVKRLKAELLRLQLLMDARKSEIRLQVTQAVENIKTARARKDVAERALRQAEENFRMVSDGFEAGTLTNTDYLDAHIALESAKTGAVIAGMDEIRGWILYYSARGTDLEEVLR